VRIVNDEAIRTHGAVRFRSEYHYAVFEYWRSAKVLRFLERSGVNSLGRVLDDGCGGGGMTVSFGEEAESVVGIDLNDRFSEAGTKLAAEKGTINVGFVRANGQTLPFAERQFDTVFSHAVIEHVADPRAYVHEIRRVLRPGGRVFLQTAPYLSPSGAHLPRLRIPVPVHLLLGRTLAFGLCRWLGAHAAWALDAPAEGTSFISMAKRGETKRDDLLYLVTVRNLRQHIADAGLRIVREDLLVSGLAKRWLPGPVRRALTRIPLVRDVVVANMEYVLAAD
jgi:2-polyprenyl-3-methyl-5-hydroxy-6-metoxy-1,4-benzoquinol methylase